jgi:uncharacterized delta-60 repeat protein
MQRRSHITRRRPNTVGLSIFHRRLACEALEDRRLLTVSIGGSIWSDLDGNGIQDTGEPGVTGAVVEIFSSVDGTIGGTDDVSRGVAIADANGGYMFSGLPAGANYYEICRAPVGYTFTVKDAPDSTDANDSDADAAGVTSLFTVSDGDTDTTRDAGLMGAAPQFGFAARAGDGAADYGFATTTDAAGNVYSTGVFSTGTADFDPGPGTYNLVNGGLGDVFIAKYTSVGALVWARRIGGAASEYGRGIAVDSDGNVYTAGNFNYTADFDPGPGVCNLTSAGYSEIFVSKLDSSGNLVWARRMGGTEPDVATSIAVGTDGNVCITGNFSGTAVFSASAPAVSLTSAGNCDAFVAKLNASGDLLWARGIGGTDYDYGYGVAVTSDGSVCTVGTFGAVADFDPGDATSNLTSAGGYDVFISKLDSQGNYVWARRVGGSYGDDGYGIATTSDGSVYTTGSFYGSADFDPGDPVFSLTSSGTTNAFVSKLDSSGNFVWAADLGRGGYATGQSIAVVEGRCIYVTGQFSDTADFNPGPAAFELTSAGSDDVFVSALNIQGNLISARRMGGTGSDYGYAVAARSDGMVSVAGSFNGAADFDPGNGTFELSSAGQTDAFVSSFRDDTLFLTLDIAAQSISETAGTAATTATVTRNWASADPLTVYLTSSDVTEAVVPSSVTIPANQSSVTFSIDAVNDAVVDGTQSVTIRASVFQEHSFGLDLSFGSGGVATTSLSGTVLDSGRMALQPDGKLLAASATSSSSWRVTRFNSDGSLDTTFGTNGVVDTTLAGGTYPEVHSIVVQSDGKILAGGKYAGGTGTSVLVRYNANGSLDTSFGSSGIASLTWITGWIEDIAVRPNGKILLAISFNGTVYFRVAQLNSNGSRDTTFGLSSGYSTFTGINDLARTVVLLDSGAFVLAGGGGGSAHVARCTSDGRLDTTFGTAGSVAINYNVVINDAAADAQGRLVLAGHGTLGSNVDMVAMRLNANGAWDTSFSDDGIVATDFAGYADDALSLALQADGKIVLAGTAKTSTTASCSALLRYDVNGVLDATFGADGRYFDTIAPSSYSQETIPSIALQPDGELVALVSSLGHSLARFSMGPGLTVLARDTLDVTDDDVAGFIVNPSATLVTTEAGGTATCTIVLTSQPTANVTFSLSSSDTSEGTVSPSSLTFTPSNWNAPQSITVTSVNDSVVDGDITYSIVTSTVTSSDPNYSGLNPPDVPVVNRDDDTPTLTLTISAASVLESAGTAATTATVTRNTSTANSLLVYLASSDATEANVPSSVSIPAGQTSVTLNVSAVDDTIRDGTQTVTITASAAGFANVVDTLDVLDNESGVLFVDVNSTTPDSDPTVGTTWAKAYKQLQSALAAAATRNSDSNMSNNIGEIWVADGTYVPSSVRADGFQMVANVAIYGGFQGIGSSTPEGSLNDRARNSQGKLIYQTVLSGDVNRDDAPGLTLSQLLQHPTRQDNAYRVVSADNTPGVVIDGVTVTGGTSGSYDGGGVLAVAHYGGTCDITLNEMILTGNAAGGSGGAVAASDAAVTITNCTIAGNIAARGGGFGDSLINSKPLTIVNSLITDNVAFIGGAISVSTSVSITQSTIAGNAALTAGGIGYFNGGANQSGSVLAKNTLIAGNLAAQYPDTAAKFVAGADYNLIGVWEGTSAIGDHSLAGTPAAPLSVGLSDWTLRSDGTWGYYLLTGSPAIDAGNNAFAVAPSGTTLAADVYGNARIVGAAVDIGAIEGGTTPAAGRTFVVQSLAKTIASDGILTFAEAFQAANSNQAVGDAQPGSFANRDTIEFAPGLSGSLPLGGNALAIYGHLSIAGPGASLVSIDAGGLSQVAEIRPAADVVLAGLTLTAGATNANGGAIANFGTIHLENSTVSSSSATQYGGAVYNLGSLNIIGSTLTGNAASRGGAIFSEAPLTISQSTFTANSGSVDGGMLCFYNANAVITETTISGNTARYGGAIYNYSGTMQIADSTFTNNSATVNGGGIELPSDYDYPYGTTTVIRSTFQGNRAGADGGAICLEDGTAKVVQSKFLANSADQGGGIWNDDTLLVTQSEFVGNSAVTKGGGICHYYYGTVFLRDSTLAGNSAAIGGGFAEANSGNLIAYNTIVAKNVAVTYPDVNSLYWRTSFYDLFGVGMDDTGLPNGQNGIIAGSPSLPVDPLFKRNPNDGGDGWVDNPDTPGVDESANNDYGDLSLRLGSPAIDTGDQTRLPADEFDLDADGNVAELLPVDFVAGPRVIGSQLDMGLFETFLPELALSNASVAENQPVGAVVGSFSCTAPNPDETFTYTLVSGTGDDDNAAFTIDAAGRLLTAAIFDFEAESSYSVRVRSTNQGGDSVEAVFVIAVLDVPEDTTPPAVTNILVRGSSWATAFPYHAGYPIPVGSGSQLVALPWVNVDQITVAFSENVAIDKSGLLLSGINAATYNVIGSTFSYDAATFAATWVLPQAIGADKLLIHLNADGADPIADESGNRLDGEWTNPTSTAQPSSSIYPSGDGNPGGDFLFRVNVLPGDANRDGYVKTSDALAILPNLNKAAGTSGYTPFIDVDGNGQIKTTDTLAVLPKLNTSLPSGEPVAGSFPSGAGHVLSGRPRAAQPRRPTLGELPNGVPSLSLPTSPSPALTPAAAPCSPRSQSDGAGGMALQPALPVALGRSKQPSKAGLIAADSAVLWMVDRLAAKKPLESSLGSLLGDRQPVSTRCVTNSLLAETSHWKASPDAAESNGDHAHAK